MVVYPILDGQMSSIALLITIKYIVKYIKMLIFFLKVLLNNFFLKTISADFTALIEQLLSTSNGLCGKVIFLTLLRC